MLKRKLAFMSQQVGIRIQKRRKLLRVSRADLGKAAGCSEQAIGQWERGDIKEIGAEKLRAAAKRLNCTVEYLLTGKESQVRTPGMPETTKTGGGIGKQLSEGAQWVSWVFDQLPHARQQSIADAVIVAAKANGLDVELPKAFHVPGGDDHAQRAKAKPRRSHRTAGPVSQSEP